ILSDASAGFALFSICPMLTMTLPIEINTVVVALVVLLPPLSIIIRTGLDDSTLSVLLPITAMLIVFSVIVGRWFERVVRQSQERAELIEQLEASRAEISRLSHEAGTSAERERLAREIHDTLAQGFTSIVTLLQAVESELDSDPAA